MSAVTRIGQRAFRIDFVKLRRETQPWLRRLIPSPEHVEVDPFLIAQAVRAIMQQCETKSVHGQLLVWNEFKVFLSSKDHSGLRPLVSGLQAGLDTVIEQTLKDLRAETIGDPVVRILIDEAQELARGICEVGVDFVENRSFAPPASGEVTVRVKRGRPRRRPPREERTRPVPEGAGPGSLRLAWEGNEVAIAAGSKVMVGRPHPGPPPGFVPLVGAGKRISSLHLAIENASNGVVITRLSNANPVAVGGRLVQRGGKLSVGALPVEIVLSNGEMVLHLKQQ